MMKRRSAVLVIVLSFMWLTCGGGGDGGTGPEPQPPKITSGPATSGITAEGVTITWTTDKAATSMVKYGESVSYTDSVSSAGLVTSHSVSLTGLDPLKTYNYSIASEDADGRRVTSGNRTFETLSPAPGLVIEGWGLFSQDDLNPALEKFREAYAYEPDNVDVLEGLGWTMLGLYRFEHSDPESLSSRKAFDDALALEPQRVDCLVGRAFLYQALEMYLEAYNTAVTALSSGGENYEFEHDPDITASDLQYCQVVSLVGLGSFDLALSKAKLLDPSIDLDPDDASTWAGHLSFEEALVVLVESLRDQV